IPHLTGPDEDLAKYIPWHKPTPPAVVIDSAAITYLRPALEAKVLTSDLNPQKLKAHLTQQYERWWSIDLDQFASKEHFLRYAGRYVRRPPIAQYRFVKITDREVQFWTKDKIQK